MHPTDAHVKIKISVLNKLLSNLNDSLILEQNQALFLKILIEKYDRLTKNNNIVDIIDELIKTEYEYHNILDKIITNNIVWQQYISNFSKIKSTLIKHIINEHNLKQDINKRDIVKTLLIKKGNKYQRYVADNKSIDRFADELIKRKVYFRVLNGC